MPMHDWTRVRPGTFHHFHQTWIGNLAAALNKGRLPRGYFALAEQRVRGPEPDVITLEQPGGAPALNGNTGGVAVQTTPPKTRFVFETDLENYARRADRLAIRHDEGGLVAIIEIMSPGNKDSRHALAAFVGKSVEFLEAGIHLLIVDPFPPTARDPQGVHRAIWDELGADPFELPVDKRLTFVSYMVGGKTVAYIEPVAVGDRLPDMPLFITPGRHVPCPLEETYTTTWDEFPDALKGPLEG